MTGLISQKQHAAEIESGLSSFSGTVVWHHYSALFRNVLLTDGTRYLAEAAKAFWLMDAIASHLVPRRKEHPDEWLFTCRLDTKDGVGVLQITADDQVIVTQAIAPTDFPLVQVTIRAAWDEASFNGLHLILCLPNEE